MGQSEAFLRILLTGAKGKGDIFLSFLLRCEDVLLEFLILISSLAMGRNLFATGEAEVEQRSAKIRDGMRKNDIEKKRALLRYAVSSSNC